MKSSDLIQHVNDSLPFLMPEKPPRDATTRTAWKSGGWKDTLISQSAEVFDVLRFAIHEGDAQARNEKLHDELDKLLDDEELENFHLKMRDATSRLLGDSPEENDDPESEQPITGTEIARRQHAKDDGRTYATDSIPCNIKPCAKKRTLV